MAERDDELARLRREAEQWRHEVGAMKHKLSSSGDLRFRIKQLEDANAGLERQIVKLRREISCERDAWARRQEKERLLDALLGRQLSPEEFLRLVDWFDVNLDRK